MKAFARVVAYAVGIAVLAALGALQLASDSLYASRAAARSVPRAVPVRLGVALYDGLDRALAPQFAAITLSEYALGRDRLMESRRYALAVRARDVRDEMLARIATASGDRGLARVYFFAAPDAAELASEALAQAQSDPAAAYAFERRARARIASLQTHPDDVAQADWIMGRIAQRCAMRYGRLRRAWLQRAAADEDGAAALAPFSEKYLRAAASADRRTGDRAGAARWMARLRSIDPDAAPH
ncbi:MAG: hypothetical protein ACREMP_05435 [Candidatus Tyrphobacter sp.]